MLELWNKLEMKEGEIYLRGHPVPPYIRKQRAFLNESAYLRGKCEKSLDKYVEKMGHFWTNMSRT